MPQNNLLNPDNNNNNAVEEEQNPGSSNTGTNDENIMNETPLSNFQYSETKGYYQSEVLHKKTQTVTLNSITSIISRLWSDEEIAIYKEKHTEWVRIQDNRVIIPNAIYKKLNKALNSFSESTKKNMRIDLVKFVLISDMYVHFPSPFVYLPNLLTQMNKHKKQAEGFLVKIAKLTRGTDGKVQTFSNFPILITSSEGFKNWCQVLKKESSALLFNSIHEAGFETLEVIEEKRANKSTDKKNMNKRSKKNTENKENIKQGNLIYLGFLGYFYFDESQNVYFSLGKSQISNRLKNAANEFNIILKEIIPRNRYYAARLTVNPTENKLQLTQNSMNIILQYINKKDINETYQEWKFSEDEDGNYLYLPPWGTIRRNIISAVKRSTKNQIVFSTKRLFIKKEGDIYSKIAIKITKNGLEKWKELIQETPEILPLEDQAKQRGYIIPKEQDKNKYNDWNNSDSVSEIIDVDIVQTDSVIRDNETTANEEPNSAHIASSPFDAKSYLQGLQNFNHYSDNHITQDQPYPTQTYPNLNIIQSDNRPLNYERSNYPLPNRNYYTQPSFTININNVNSNLLGLQYLHPDQSQEVENTFNINPAIHYPPQSQSAFNETNLNNPTYDSVLAQLYVRTNTLNNTLPNMLTPSYSYDYPQHTNQTTSFLDPFTNPGNTSSYGTDQNFAYLTNQTNNVRGQSNMVVNIPSMNAPSNLTNNTNVTSFASIHQQLGMVNQNNVAQQPLLEPNTYFAAPLPLFPQGQGFFPTSQFNLASTNLTEAQILNQFNVNENSENLPSYNFGNINH